MTQIRPRKRGKYRISAGALQTVRGYCRRYHEWQEELTALEPRPKSQTGGDAQGSGGGDVVSTVAMARVELQAAIDLINDTIAEACGDDYGMREYLLMYVTEDGMTYDKARARGIPCGASYFYRLREKFYYMLSKKNLVQPQHYGDGFV